MADGTQLTDLDLNGTNFVSKKELTPETFKGKLSKVIIEGDADADEAGLIGTHEHMELVQIAHYTQKIHGCDDGWYFVLRDVSPENLRTLTIEGNIDYIAMMTGITL